MANAFPSSPARADGRLRHWQKVLGTLQNGAGALAGNNPRATDGLRTTLVKVLNALQGRSGPDVSGLAAVPLGVLANTDLDWSGYAGPTPDHWDIYKNNVLSASVAGTNIDYLAQSGQWYIIGRNGSGDAVTQQSNTVTI